MLGLGCLLGLVLAASLLPNKNSEAAKRGAGTEAGARLINQK